MDLASKVEAYYAKERPFKKGILTLRQLVLETALTETYKWNFPVYTINTKNVLSICAFKHHFSIWFYNGVFLKDELNVLQNAQEGKTKAMRHWKFTAHKEIDTAKVLTYVNEAIENQKKGLVLAPQKKVKKNLAVPELLKQELTKDTQLNTAFKNLSPYRQRAYYAYITSAKQAKTKENRLVKIIPMILAGKGLNDMYRSGV